MDKVSQLLSTKALLTMLTIVVAITLLLAGCKSRSLHNQILDYCKNQEELSLSEITDFSWDVAYVDRQYYGSGEKLKESYNIEGKFQLLETDFSSRVAFCKDGRLVYDLVLNNFYFEFESSIEIIDRDSVFTINWSSVPDQKEQKLLLSLQE